MIMNRIICIFAWVFAAVLMASCSGLDIKENSGEDITVFPDYKDVTVPFNIAPLNFMTDQVRKGKVMVATENGEQLVRPLKNGKVSFPVRRWHSILESAKGGTLSVTVMDTKGKAYKPFCIKGKLLTLRVINRLLIK